MDQKVEEMLISKWDPINIADVPDVGDYRLYTNSIEMILPDELLKHQRSSALLKFEREDIGFECNVERASWVAAILMFMNMS